MEPEPDSGRPPEASMAQGRMAELRAGAEPFVPKRQVRQMLEDCRYCATVGIVGGNKRLCRRSQRPSVTSGDPTGRGEIPGVLCAAGEEPLRKDTNIRAKD